MLRILLGCLFALAALAAPLPAQAPKRIALVVGINSYPKLAAGLQLTRAVADAETMADTLRGLQFDVELARDVDRTGFLTALDRVKRRIGPGDTVFVFYAGHGVELKGSYLVLTSEEPPVDPKPCRL